jgi:DME family drug/metabolite transporter
MTRVQGSLLILIAGLAFSVGPLAFAGAKETSTAAQYLTYRCASVAIVAAIFLMRNNRRNSIAAIKRGGLPHLVAGVILGSMFMLFIAALTHTDAATTLFLQAAAPFFTALIGYAILKERVARDTWIAMMIAGVGITVMVLTKLGGDDMTGIMLAGLIPVGLGFYTVLIKTRSEADPNIAVLVGGLFATTCAGSIALANNGLSVPIDDVAFATLGGGLALGLGIPLYNIGSRVVPAAEMTLLMMTEVIFAPVWVWIWPGERPEALTIVGGLIILSAVVWLALRARHSPEIKALRRTANRSTL